MYNYLGNKELLKKWKIGFLASRKISTSSILPTLDWAVSISKRTDVAVVSGFHSRLEKEVLKILLQGKSGIIVVLARGMYCKLPKQYEEVMKENRLLVISNEKENIKRISEVTAHKRNKYIMDICEEIKLVGVDEHSSLCGFIK
jgi:predicted Rossmann fold nucleotide-binding protein DprA/Smf involved in DNA uptake